MSQETLVFKPLGILFSDGKYLCIRSPTVRADLHEIIHSHFSNTISPSTMVIRRFRSSSTTTISAYFPAEMDPLS